MAARYERQLLRVQGSGRANTATTGSTQGGGGRGRGRGRGSATARRRHRDAGADEAEVTALRKRVHDLQATLEASQAVWVQKNEELQGQVDRAVQQAKRVQRDAPAESAVTPVHRRTPGGGNHGSAASASPSSPRTANRQFLRRGEGLRADSARANSLGNTASSRSQSAVRTPRTRRGAPSTRVASGGRRGRTGTDEAAGEAAAQQRAEAIERLQKQLEDSEEVRAELQRALHADADAQRREIEKTKLEATKAHKQRLKKLVRAWFACLLASFGWFVFVWVVRAAVRSWTWRDGSRSARIERAHLALWLGWRAKFVYVRARLNFVVGAAVVSLAQPLIRSLIDVGGTA